MANRDSKLLTIFEWIVGGLITAFALGLHFLRVVYGGPLWRDEIAALNLARSDSWSEILASFPHEAFPLFFPALVREYSALAGTGPTALRVLGCLIGVLCLLVIWWNARWIRQTLPLVALALFAFNPIFFVWGDTIRGYGLGSAFIMLTFVFFAQIVVKPSPAVFCGALMAAILSVQCLLANAVLLFAIGGSAAIACAFQRRGKDALIILGIGFLSALSLVPYLRPYQEARAWDIVLRTDVSLSWLYHEFCNALGNPTQGMLVVWFLLLLFSLIGFSGLRQGQSSEKSPDGVLALFALLTCLLASACYFVFLMVLRYKTQEWYFMALIAVLIVSLDTLVGLLATRVEWGRMARLLLVVAVAAVMALPAFRIAHIRMTNIDVIAQELREKAVPDDFIVVVPWNLGVSFRQYYQASTPWQTIPPIRDLRIHRYDLSKEQMTLTDPLAPVLKQAADALSSGHRLWIIGTPSFTPTNETPPYLAPAPYDPVGWSENDYRVAWLVQVEHFVQAKAAHYTIEVKTSPRTNPFENDQLIRVEGAGAGLR